MQVILLSLIGLTTITLLPTQVKAQATKPVVDLSIGNRWVYDWVRHIPGQSRPTYSVIIADIIGEEIFDGRRFARVRLRNTETGFSQTEFWSADAESVVILEAQFCSYIGPDSLRTHWDSELTETVMDIPMCGAPDLDHDLLVHNQADLREYKTPWRSYAAQRWSYAVSYAGGTTTETTTLAAGIGFLEIEYRDFNANAPVPGAWIELSTLRGAVIDGVLTGDTNTVTFVNENLAQSDAGKGYTLNIFPNPIEEIARFTLAVSPNVLSVYCSNQVDLAIFDFTGRRMTQSFELQNSGESRMSGSIDVSSLGSGTYVFELRVAGIPRTQVLIHKH